MSATPQVTGPVLIYVGFPTNPANQAGGLFGGTIQFLGTAEKCPRWSNRAAWVPVYNDLGGQSIAADVLYEGNECFVMADMTSWDDAVLQALMARPFSLTPDGIDIPGDLGTMMVTEGAAPTLYLTFPYSTRAPAVRAGMPAGRRFPAAILESPDDFDSMGTAPRKVRLLWHCYRVAQAIGPQGMTWLLYDSNVAGLPAPNH